MALSIAYAIIAINASFYLLVLYGKYSIEKYLLQVPEKKGAQASGILIEEVPS